MVVQAIAAGVFGHRPASLNAGHIVASGFGTTQWPLVHEANVRHMSPRGSVPYSHTAPSRKQITPAIGSRTGQRRAAPPSSPASPPPSLVVLAPPEPAPAPPPLPVLPP